MADIDMDMTLQCAAHTLGRVLGISQERLADRIYSPALAASAGL